MRSQRSPTSRRLFFLWGAGNNIKKKANRAKTKHIKKEKKKTYYCVFGFQESAA